MIYLRYRIETVSSEQSPRSHSQLVRVNSLKLCGGRLRYSVADYASAMMLPAIEITIISYLYLDTEICMLFYWETY